MTNIQDPSFLIFANQEQNQRDENNKLGVFDLITMDKIRSGISSSLNTDIVQKLLTQNVIIHELCHLIQHDHTRKFIDLQTKEMPDWEKWKLKLEIVLA